MKPSAKIVLIGAGRLANHLGLQLATKGLSIVQVFSRTRRKAVALSKKLNTEFTTDLNSISTSGSLYILAVADDAIQEVAARLGQNKKLQDKLFVHTSGATPSTVFNPFLRNYGVFYPLQTFSAQRTIDFSSIPICIDARYVKHRKLLRQLAHQISERVFEVNDKERAILHVAAVFVNNFSNHMFAIAEQIVDKEGLSFDILRPLLLETALKVQNNSPAKMQTGPAVRKDAATIRQHLDFLEKEHPQLVEIYRLVSNSI